MAPPTILILNDDPQLVEAFKSVLEEDGVYRVESRLTRTVEDVVATVPDLVIVDTPPSALGTMLNFVQRLRLDRRTMSLPIILTTSSLQHIEPQILREDLIHVLVKPFTLERLLSTIETLLATAPKQDEPREGGRGTKRG